jgi:glycosyltransferase involved in cell wall biosynthesis
MRVLQLGPYPPPHGGVQTNLVAIRRYLLERGIPCQVINLTRFRDVSADGVYFPRNGLQVIWLLLRLRYDIIHLHIGGNVTTRLLALCLFCCLIPRKRTLLTFHSGGYPLSKEGRRASVRSLAGFVFRLVDKVIAVNPAIVELFHKYGLADDRVCLIQPHAPPPEAPNVALPATVQNFFVSHRPVLLTVGLLEPEYDLTLQIEALGSIRKRFPAAGLVIIGSGSLEERLRSIIASKDYADHILLCGDMPHDVTLRAIASSDLLLRTTLYDGDSIAVREALHFGTPVIAADNGMRPEGVHLIAPGNIAALCEAIEQDVGGGRPIARQERRISDNSNLEAVLNLYYEVLRRASGNSRDGS